MKHRIKTAYDAWWFLYNHPKLCLRSRCPISTEEARNQRELGFIITQDRGHKSNYVPGVGNVGFVPGQHYREWRHHFHHAIEENLSIFYAMVDEDGECQGSNGPLRPECWLEFGPMEWGYASEWHDSTERMNFHAVELDCGAPTFDEALVKLARLVKKHYGDYRWKDYRGTCGKPRCADCTELGPIHKALKKRREG